MHGADYIISVVLFVSLILGFIRGFVRESIMLVAWLVGIWVAWHYAYLLSPYLGGLLGQPGAQQWAGRAIILVGALLFGSAVASLAAYFTHRAIGLEIGDRLLGAAFGFVRAVAVIGFGITVGHALELDGEAWWTRSRLVPYAEVVAHWLERYAEPSVERMIEEAAGKAGR